MSNTKDHFLGRHYEATHTSGPFQGLNPTNRWLAVEKHKEKDERAAATTATNGLGAQDAEQTSASTSDGDSDVYHVWRSRDNRKGRHAVAVSSDYHEKGRGTQGPRPTNTLAQSLRGLLKMLVRYPVWDVSYDVAVVFTIGERAQSSSRPVLCHGNGL